MKLLITGGAGFIGSNLARYAQENGGHEVVVLDDLSTGSRENLAGLDVDFIEGSILDDEVIDRAVRGVDSIIHLGAIPSVPRSVKNPVASHHANATGTLNVLEAARTNDVEHVVVASSSSVYGSNPRLPKSEYDWTRPMSPYAVSKHATEGYAIAYNYSYGLKTLAFRFFNVYGPGQAAGHSYAAVIPQFVDAALAGRPLPVNGDGTQSRDFTFVDSVCAALLESSEKQIASFDPVNLAFGSNTNLLSLIELLGTELGSKLEVEFHPARIGDVKASQADSTRLSELFPAIKPWPIENGLARTIEWYKEQR